MNEVSGATGDVVPRCKCLPLQFAMVNFPYGYLFITFVWPFVNVLQHEVPASHYECVGPRNKCENKKKFNRSPVEMECKGYDGMNRTEDENE